MNSSLSSLIETGEPPRRHWKDTWRDPDVFRDLDQAMKVSPDKPRIEMPKIPKSFRFTPVPGVHCPLCNGDMATAGKKGFKCRECGRYYQPGNPNAEKRAENDRKRPIIIAMLKAGKTPVEIETVLGYRAQYVRVIRRRLAKGLKV